MHVYLSGLKSSGELQKRGSLCNRCTGMPTMVPSGMVMPWTCTVFLHILSSRGAVGTKRWDSQITWSRYWRPSTSSYETGAYGQKVKEASNTEINRWGLGCWMIYYIWQRITCKVTVHLWAGWHRVLPARSASHQGWWPDCKGCTWEWHWWSHSHQRWKLKPGKGSRAQSNLHQSQEKSSARKLLSQAQTLTFIFTPNTYSSFILKIYEENLGVYFRSLFKVLCYCCYYCWLLFT